MDLKVKQLQNQISDCEKKFDLAPPCLKETIREELETLQFKLAMLKTVISKSSLG